MSEDLMSMLSFWLRHLETRLYKTKALNTEASLETHLDRILLFLEYAKENKHKDTPLIMVSYRFLFPYAELYLKLKAKRIALGERTWSTTKTLRSPELKNTLMLLSIKTTLENKGLPVTHANIFTEWVNYTTQKNGKAPGKLAIRNFESKLQQHECAILSVREQERAYVYRSDISLVSD